MTSDLVTIRQIHNPLELTERDREAAQAVASGLRDAKAANTRRAYASAWLRFQAWADAGGHPTLPASPQAVALYLGHLAAEGKAIATIEQARAAISHFHAAAGMQKSDNPARHPVVAEGRKGLAQPGPGTQAGRRPDLRCPDPGPRGPPPAQTWPWRQDGISGNRPQARRPGPGHHRGPGRRRTPALRSSRPDLGRRGVVGRRHRTHHGPD